MVAGRIGASIAAEIGTMRVTEQIDALTTLSTNPYNYIFCQIAYLPLNIGYETFFNRRLRFSFKTTAGCILFSIIVSSIIVPQVIHRQP